MVAFRQYPRRIQISKGQNISTDTSGTRQFAATSSQGKTNIIMLETEVILLSVLVFVTCVRTEANNYCDMCKNHTMCVYPEFGPKCSTPVAHSVDDAVKTHIVEEHNKLRSVVAQGQETRGAPGPQPSAADIKKMMWDDELAKVAQRWANQCIFAHDECRIVNRFVVGQNIFQWSSTYRSGVVPANETQDVHRTAWTTAVTAWYNEVAKFNPKHIDPFKFSAETGHYTAMMWANTDRVGCGFVTFLGPKDGWYSKQFVCNYGPAGNVLGAAMYQAGSAATKCQQPDTGYPALCAS